MLAPKHMTLEPSKDWICADLQYRVVVISADLLRTICFATGVQDLQRLHAAVASSLSVSAAPALPQQLLHRADGFGPFLAGFFASFRQPVCCCEFLNTCVGDPDGHVGGEELVASVLVPKLEPCSHDSAWTFSRALGSAGPTVPWRLQTDQFKLCSVWRHQKQPLSCTARSVAEGSTVFFCCSKRRHRASHETQPDVTSLDI